jgi:MFS transporter, DHA2 family, multidrug resistance protein
MGQLDINLTSFDVFWTNVLLGFGQSIAFTPMTVLAFATLPQRQITEGAAVFTLMRNFGSSLFISISVLLLLRSTSSNYASMTEFVTPFGSTASLSRLPGAWNVETMPGLMRLSGEMTRQAAMIGYVNAFHLMAYAAAAAIPLVFLLRVAPRDP